MEHRFIITNDGNVALRQLNVGGLSLTQGVNCSIGDLASLVSNPVPVLAVGEVLSCVGVFTFTQEHIELGNAAGAVVHTTRAASVNIVPGANTAFTKNITLADVTVPNNPMLHAFIHTSTCVDILPAPWKQRKWLQLLALRGVCNGRLHTIPLCLSQTYRDTPLLGRGLACTYLTCQIAQHSTFSYSASQTTNLYASVLVACCCLQLPRLCARMEQRSETLAMSGWLLSKSAGQSTAACLQGSCSLLGTASIAR